MQHPASTGFLFGGSYDKSTEITAVTIAAAAKLAAPERIWKFITHGPRYHDAAWKSGISGRNFDPEQHGCDWLIGFCRETGVEPSIQLLKRIEKIIREEQK